MIQKECKKIISFIQNNQYAMKGRYHKSNFKVDPQGNRKSGKRELPKKI